MRRHFVPVSGGMGVALGAALAWPFTVDDSFIVARYARHLVAGQGYCMNPGLGASDGVTGPLWLLPAMVDARWGTAFGSLWFTKAFGVTCGVAAAMWLLAACSRCCGGRVTAAWAALVLALQPSYWTWLGAGLETGLAALSVVAAAVSRSAWTASAAAGLLSWLRPELVPVGLSLGLLRFWRGGRWFHGLPVALLGLGVVAFRWSLFERVLPLTASAKPASLSVGLEYLGRGLLLTTGLLGLIPLAWLCWQRRPRESIWFASWLLGLCCIALAGGDWMPGFRLFAPLIPLYAGLLGCGLFSLGRRSPRWACTLGIAACVLPAIDAYARVPDLLHSARARLAAAEPLANAVRNHAGTVALVDVGYIGWRTDLPVMDLGGLTASDLGQLPGAHLNKQISSRIVAKYAPTQAVLHSQVPPQVDSAGRLRHFRGYPVEHRFARVADVPRRYRVQRIFRYSDSYYYIWLVRLD